MSYTKGEWSVFYKHKYDEWHVSIPMHDDGMKIALFPNGIQTENQEDDARLISAAPDLLEALQATNIDLRILRGNVLSASKTENRWDGMADVIDEWIAKNESAIAKALGK